jgi:hypothetical protein
MSRVPVYMIPRSTVSLAINITSLSLLSNGIQEFKQGWVRTSANICYVSKNDNKPLGRDVPCMACGFTGVRGSGIYFVTVKFLVGRLGSGKVETQMN